MESGQPHYQTLKELRRNAAAALLLLIAVTFGTAFVMAIW